MPHRCPRCFFARSWSLRRHKRKCKRCRHEFSVRRYPVPGSRATTEQWQQAIAIFLRERTILRITAEVGLSQKTVQHMTTHLRSVMAADRPACFRGPVEMDETYIGGQRKNQRLHIRRIHGKRGHGTEKLPIVGLFDRAGKQAYVEVLSKKLSMPHIFSVMDRQVVAGAWVFTDGFKMYRGLARHGFLHEYVDHDGGEYVRGDVHTNNIEGFWGILKRRLGCIGGMRRNRLHLFVAEIVWKFNHRLLPLGEQEKLLYTLITPR